MAKTLKEVAKRVLQDLGRLPNGQVATAAQENIILDAYNGVYESLLNDEIVNWASDDDVPDFAVRAVVTLLKGQVAEAFGNNPNPFLAQEQSMRQILSRQIVNNYAPETTEFKNI